MKGQYADITLHAGLVCLNGPPNMDFAMQIELFKQALEALNPEPDLVNQVLEITIGDAGSKIWRYHLPQVRE